MLLATIDYLAEQAKRVDYGGLDMIAHYQQIKEQTEEQFRKRRLTRLKQWLRDMTEGPREVGDLALERYIKEKTGHDIDIFGSFRKRIDKIIERKRVNTEHEY